MENLNIDKLEQINYPNTISSQEQNSYSKANGYEFKGIMKSGEMAGIQWFQVYKNGKLVAEIKESICDLYYEN